MKLQLLSVFLNGCSSFQDLLLSIQAASQTPRKALQLNWRSLQLASSKQLLIIASDLKNPFMFFVHLNLKSCNRAQMECRGEHGTVTHQLDFSLPHELCSWPAGLRKCFSSPLGYFLPCFTIIFNTYLHDFFPLLCQ